MPDEFPEIFPSHQTLRALMPQAFR